VAAGRAGAAAAAPPAATIADKRGGVTSTTAGSAGGLPPPAVVADGSNDAAAVGDDDDAAPPAAAVADAGRGAVTPSTLLWPPGGSAVAAPAPAMATYVTAAAAAVAAAVPADAGDWLPGAPACGGGDRGSRAPGCVGDSSDPTDAPGVPPDALLGVPPEGLGEPRAVGGEPLSQNAFTFCCKARRFSSARSSRRRWDAADPEPEPEPEPEPSRGLGPTELLEEPSSSSGSANVTWPAGGTPDGEPRLPPLPPPLDAAAGGVVVVVVVVAVPARDRALLLACGLAAADAASRDACAGAATSITESVPAAAGVAASSDPGPWPEARAGGVGDGVNG